MRKLVSGIAAASALALTVGAAGPANAALSQKPLSDVLTADKDMFDSNWHDYDIVTEAVLAVLQAKPSSAVSVLTDGSTRLTAFVPNDRAFQLLAKDLTGRTFKRERVVFNQLVKAVGVDTIEQVLLYHVVPGATINSKAALGANGAKLTTAEGKKFTVRVAHGSIRLADKDRNSRNPRVNVVDINKGNRQIAHGIDRVLRPFDLPPIKGQNALAGVLTADGNRFDSNWKDFDVVTEAVLAVLKAKPSSPVSLLTQGDKALTAFVPNDRAFRKLVADLTGTQPATERAAFKAVAGLGIDTVETVLLYHVVPGATITAAQALQANGAALTTGAGKTIKVRVKGSGVGQYIKLSDKDYNSRNPRVIATDVNKGNLQIAHVIDRVLRPIDL